MFHLQIKQAGVITEQTILKDYGIQFQSKHVCLPAGRPGTYFTDKTIYYTWSLVTNTQPCLQKLRDLPNGGFGVKNTYATWAGTETYCRFLPTFIEKNTACLHSTRSLLRTVVYKSWLKQPDQESKPFFLEKLKICIVF